MRISVIMEALTGKFTTDTDRASKQFQRDMKKMQRDAAKMGKAIGVAVAAATAALVALTKSSVSFADDLAKSAKTVGVGVEALQELRFAAEQSGIEAKGLDDSLRKLMRGAGEFARSGGGPAAKAFQDLGISVVDAGGKVKDTEALFLDIVSAMEGIDDQARRTAMQAQLFGDDFGPKLDVLIRQGISGLSNFRQQARDLGIVLSAELAANAENVADKMNIFNRVMRTQIATVVLENAAAISAMIDGLVRMIPPLVNGTARLLEFIGVLKDIPLSVREENLAIIGQTLREIDRDIMIAMDLGLPTAGLQRRKDRLVAELRSEEDAYIAAKRRVEEALTIAVPTVAVTGIPSGAAPAPPPVLDDSIARTIAQLDQQAAVLGMTANEVQLYQLSLDGATDAQLRHAEAVLGTIESHGRYIDLQREAEQVMQDNKTTAELFVDEIARLNDLWTAGVLSGEEYQKAVIRIQDSFFPAAEAAEEAFSQMDEFAKQAARNMQDVFAQLIFDPFSDGLSGMVRGFADTMRRMLAEAAAAALLKQLFGGLSGSGNSFLSALGASFGGSRDSGGRGSPGKAYYIGTGAQPEMFIPDTAGTFVPANKQGGVSNTFNTIVQAPRGRITRESEGRLRARDAMLGSQMASRNA